MRLKELVALVCTEMTFTLYEKGVVPSQKLMFNMQQGHVPMRVYDCLRSLVCAKGLK